MHVQRTLPGVAAPCRCVVPHLRATCLDASARLKHERSVAALAHAKGVLTHDDRARDPRGAVGTLRTEHDHAALQIAALLDGDSAARPRDRAQTEPCRVRVNHDRAVRLDGHVCGTPVASGKAKLLVAGNTRLVHAAAKDKCRGSRRGGLSEVKRCVIRHHALAHVEVERLGKCRLRLQRAGTGLHQLVRKNGSAGKRVVLRAAYGHGKRLHRARRRYRLDVVLLRTVERHRPSRLELGDLRA